jgi:hypothetical protein
MSSPGSVAKKDDASIQGNGDTHLWYGIDLDLDLMAEF